MPRSPRYRCTICMTIVETDDTEPVCNNSDRCGFLFDTDLIPAPPAPTRRGLTFTLTDVPDGGYVEGDERRYTTHYRGRTIGFVEPTWLLARTPGDPSPAGWAFTSDDRRHSGEGRTRADAVIDAYTRP